LRNGYRDDEIKQVDRDTRVCLYALLPDDCKQDINWRLLSLTIDRLSITEETINEDISLFSNFRVLMRLSVGESGRLRR